jgi:hypothetical protein
MIAEQPTPPMTTRIERHRGNEVFELTKLGMGSIDDADSEVPITEATPPHGWIAKPKFPQGFEMRYWRHHGGRAFDLRVRCCFFPSQTSNTAFINDPELKPIIQFLDKALGFARSWPFHGTHVHLRADTCMLMSIDSHAASLQVLFDMLVSHVEVETTKLT